MKLTELNKMLAETDEKLATARTELFPLEMEYQLRLDDLMLSSQRANQFSREAEARGTIMREEIYEKYQSKVLEVKILFTRLNTYMQISKNMISINFVE